MKNLTRLDARGLAESIYDFSGHLLPCPFCAHYQLVELLLDCLIVRSLNSMQKEQECQNHTREHEMEVSTSIYRPANSRAQNRTKECYS
jgi:hypothetical protein